MNMGFTLNECIYVDDTPKGLEAGVRAGVKTVHLVGLNDKIHSEKVVRIKGLRDLEALI